LPKFSPNLTICPNLINFAKKFLIGEAAASLAHTTALQRRNAERNKQFVTPHIFYPMDYCISVAQQVGVRAYGAGLM